MIGAQKNLPGGGGGTFDDAGSVACDDKLRDYLRATLGRDDMKPDEIQLTEDSPNCIECETQYQNPDLNILQTDSLVINILRQREFFLRYMLFDVVRNEKWKR